MASHLRLWPVAVIGLAVDLWSKHWAFSNPTLVDKGHMEVVPYLVDFQLMLNRGALFGLGKGWTPLFIIASVLALAFVFFLFSQSSCRRWSLHIALGMVLAGALGNLYDRAFEIADVVVYETADGSSEIITGTIIEDNEHSLLIGNFPDGKHPRQVPRTAITDVHEQGVVRDFLKIQLGPLNIWPWIFNVADVLLVGGVCILLWNFWRDRRAEKAAEAAAVPMARPQENPPSPEC